jgi:cytidine deaminase
MHPTQIIQWVQPYWLSLVGSIRVSISRTLLIQQQYVQRGSLYLTPCGSCRQVMAEFGLDTIVLIADAEGRIVNETDVSDLLPAAFTPENLVNE